MDTMHDVKEMYDGFIFGKQKDMYNPWSICNYMRSGELPVSYTHLSTVKIRLGSGCISGQRDRRVRSSSIRVVRAVRIFFPPQYHCHPAGENSRCVSDVKAIPDYIAANGNSHSLWVTAVGRYLCDRLFVASGTWC